MHIGRRILKAAIDIVSRTNENEGETQPKYLHTKSHRSPGQSHRSLSPSGLEVGEKVLSKNAVVASHPLNEPKLDSHSSNRWGGEDVATAAKKPTPVSLDVPILPRLMSECLPGSISVNQLDILVGIVQTALRGRSPVRDALTTLDAAIMRYPHTAKLHLMRSFLHYDDWNLKACVSDCRLVLNIAPTNMMARFYETAALHKAGLGSIDEPRTGIATVIAGRNYAASIKNTRLAVIIHNSCSPAEVQPLENLREVVKLYNNYSSDRCVSALAATMAFSYGYWKNSSSTMEYACAVAERMLKTWPYDQIALSVVHHAKGRSRLEEPRKVEFGARQDYGITVLIPAIFIQAENVLQYPVRILDPDIYMNFKKLLVDL